MRLIARVLALAALAATLLVAGSAVGAGAASAAGPRLNPPICC